jgi:hypothetical protein
MAMAEDDSTNSDVVAERGEPSMRIFIFKSETSPDLRAFGGDLIGSRLPKQFQPWRAVGAIGPSQNPPHKFSRDVIECAIRDQGFQLWRLSKKAADKV